MSLNNNIIVNESGTAANVENYKIVIIADQHVGKTSILSKYKYEIVAITPTNATNTVLSPPKSLTNFNVFIPKSKNILPTFSRPPSPRTSSWN